MKSTALTFAPPEVLDAALHTLRVACVYVRNQTYSSDADPLKINSLMDAVHEIPHYLASWSEDRLAEIRGQLGTFRHVLWPGSPDLLDVFNKRLQSNEQAS